MTVIEIIIIIKEIMIILIIIVIINTVINKNNKTDQIWSKSILVSLINPRKHTTALETCSASRVTPDALRRCAVKIFQRSMISLFFRIQSKLQMNAQ
jgi:hypothetical protein